MDGDGNVTVLTIGHSAHTIEEFLALLHRYGVETVIDVRSHPQSRWHRQFNKKALSASLSEAGLRYEYLGDALGGHPDDVHLYDGDGHLLYERLSGKQIRGGLQQVIEEAQKAVTAIMCTEENPAECHRHPLLARGLLERDVKVLHIRGDGATEDGSSLPQRQASQQLPLLEPPGEDERWRSPKPIRRGAGHNE